MERPSCRQTLLGEKRLQVGAVCCCGLSGAPFEFHRRGCDRTSRPYVDDEAVALVDEALECLVCLRGSGIGDAGAALSCLASLVAVAQARVLDVVADARDRGYTWDEVAARLAVTASAARRRYGDHARRRPRPPAAED